MQSNVVATVTVAAVQKSKIKINSLITVFVTKGFIFI